MYWTGPRYGNALIRLIELDGQRGGKQTNKEVLQEIRLPANYRELSGTKKDIFIAIQFCSMSKIKTTTNPQKYNHFRYHEIVSRGFTFYEEPLAPTATKIKQMLIVKPLNENQLKLIEVWLF